MSAAMSLAMPTLVGAALLLDEPVELQFDRINVNIVSVNERNGQVTVRTVADERTIILNVSDETFVVDSVNGLNTTIEERVNNQAEVYHSPVMTRSDPPITNAIAMVINIPDDYTPPRFHIVERIASYNGDLRVSVDSGGLIVTLSEDSDVTAPLMTSTGKSAGYSQIREDSKLLLWYTIVAMSHPAQTTATRAVLLVREGECEAYEPKSDEYKPAEADISEIEPDEHYAHEYEPQEPGAYHTAETEAVSGYTLHMSGTRELGRGILIPLRQVAEGLGYTVIWNEADRSVAVTLRGGNSARVVIGQNGELLDDRTYVSIDFFETYSGRAERVNDVIVFY